MWRRNKTGDGEAGPVRIPPRCVDAKNGARPPALIQNCASMHSTDAPGVGSNGSDRSIDSRAAGGAMNIDEPIERRAMLATMGQWSAAVLSMAGLGGLSTGCGGHSHAAPPPPYSDYSNYANYFDYSNYSNYCDYSNAHYHDYADYGDYANYGDYFNYADAYSDGYSDYSNYANYSDYFDYSDYSDYSDDAYSDYSDYSDFTDPTGDLNVHRRKALGNYADYADVYADSGAHTGTEESTESKTE